MNGDKGALKKAYDHLFALYGGTAYYAAYKVLRHMEQAEAAVLDTFRRLLPFLWRLQPLEREEVKHLVVLLSRRRALALNMAKEDGRNGSGVQESVLAHIDLGKTLSPLTAMMWELPESLQEVLLLRYDCGLSTVDIAALLEISADEVRGRILSAREVLAQRAAGERGGDHG